MTSSRPIRSAMHPDLLPILKACRRSRIKVRVYRGLTELRTALVPELAAFAQTTQDRVRGVLIGDGNKFRRESSLVALGIARAEPRAEGDAFVLTLHGDSAWIPVMDRLSATRGPPKG